MVPNRQTVCPGPMATAPRFPWRLPFAFVATTTAPTAKSVLEVSLAQTFILTPLLVLRDVPQSEIPRALGKESLCVLECVVAAAGSALMASIAAAAAMTEIRRSIL